MACRFTHSRVRPLRPHILSIRHNAQTPYNNDRPCYMAARPGSGYMCLGNE